MREVSKENIDQRKERKIPGWAYVTFIVALSLILIGILGAIALLGEPEEIGLSELGGHIGDEVVCRGIVVNADIGDISSEMLIYEYPQVVKVEVEGRVDVSLNDLVKVRGEVYAFGDSFRLSVASPSGVNVIGGSDIETCQPDRIVSYLNNYVFLEGVVTGVTEDNWGNSWADVISLEGGMEGCRVRLPDVVVVNSTDKLEVFGIVREDSEPYLYVYNSEACGVQKEYWKPRSYTLGMVSEAAGTGELELFPFNVTGYLKYEPGSYPSLTISDKAEGGTYSLIVDVSLVDVPELHKGDLVDITGKLFYDPAGMRYKMTAQDVELVSEHGLWNVTLEELAKNYYLFENAGIRVAGELVMDGERTVDEDMVGETGCCLEMGNISLPIVSESEPLLMEEYIGWLRFDRDGLYYYLEL